MVFEKCDDRDCVGCAMGAAVHHCREQDMPPELLVEMFFDWLRDVYGDDGEFEHTTTISKMSVH